MRVALNKIRVLRKACLKTGQSSLLEALLSRSTRDLGYKEVFKWILSPYLVKGFERPANLDGLFWVTCAFVDCEQSE